MGNGSETPPFQSCLLPFSVDLGSVPGPVPLQVWGMDLEQCLLSRSVSGQGCLARYLLESNYVQTLWPLPLQVFSILEDCFRAEQGKSLPDVVAKDNKVMEQEAKEGDLSLCRVLKNNVKPHATVGRLLNFIVSTVGAGRGTLTAAVEEGVHGQPHPLKVEQLTETMFKVLFLPERSADYSVHIYFNRQDIDGSPFSFFCAERKSDALQCSVSGRGTSEALQGREEVLQLHTLASADSKLTALVQGEYCCVSPHIAPKGGGAYDVGYALPTAGKYQLSLLWDKEHILGSPFPLHCRSPADPGDFLLDEGGPAGTQPHQPYLFQAYLRSSACHSAEVEVEARGPCGEVVQGSVCVSGSHEDTFDAEFTPKVAGTWLVSMLADGQHVSGSPFKVKVVDPRQVTAWGAGLMDGVVGERGKFTIDTQDAGEGNLVVMVHGPKGGFKLSLRKDTVHRRRILASYQPMHAGAYKIDVLWSGTHVPGSPFKVVVAASTEEIQSEL